MKFVLSALLLASAPILSAAAPQVAEPALTVQSVPPSFEKLQLARRFVSLAVRTDDMVEMMKIGMAQGSSAKLDGLTEDETEKAEAEKDMKRIMALMEPRVRQRMPNVLESYAVVYARDYSTEELQQMVTFAQSPAGQHYFAHNLAVQGDPIVVRQLEGFRSDLWPAMEEFPKEKCAAKAAQRVAMGDTKARCPLSAAKDTAAGSGGSSKRPAFRHVATDGSSG